MNAPHDRADNPCGRSVTLAILAVPKVGTVTVRLLGTVEGILTHWTGQRTVACPGLENCESRTHNKGAVWKGYAAAEYQTGQDGRDWIPCVLEITERFYEIIGTKSPRGQIWRLARVTKGNRKAREVTGELLGHFDARTARADIQVRQVIERVYRSLEIEWDQSPPFGPRQVLSIRTSEGAAQTQKSDESKTDARPKKPFSQLVKEFEQKRKATGGEA